RLGETYAAAREEQSNERQAGIARHGSLLCHPVLLCTFTKGSLRSTLAYSNERNLFQFRIVIVLVGFALPGSNLLHSCAGRHDRPKVLAVNLVVRRSIRKIVQINGG